MPASSEPAGDSPLNPLAARPPLTLPATFGPPDAGEGPVLPPGLALEEIEVLRDRYERLTVPVTFGESGPYRFMIDTGSQATVLTHRVSNELQLQPVGRGMLVATGSRKPVDMVEVAEFQFANRYFYGVRTPLLYKAHVGADGILGLDSLQDLRVLLDFRENRISVADAHDAAPDSGYEIVVRARRKLGQMIITNARIDGVRTAVIIDTGAQASVGNRALQRRLRGRNYQKGSATDVHGHEFKTELHYADELRIESLQLQSVPIGFADSPAFEHLGLDDQPAVILGMNNLRAFERIAIDFATRRILFDLPRSASTRAELQPGRASRIGF
ncbi:aspartyl protease family protein [Altererythrobacter sp. HHU K3-1]|uniref:Aspartyl protease family protein n=2 Tax=Qipengyuania atrilutea TaxID=2744473 RepID=A0A850HDV7_9SPHN|nr:aspartyl protease family protein [Actirhodobacter atriluteus]